MSRVAARAHSHYVA